MAIEGDLFPALARLAARHVEPPPGPTTGDLTRFELGARSQNGEDGVIAEIFRRIRAPTRSFVEIGAEPFESTALALAEVLGWSGLFIEADPGRAAALAARWAGPSRVRIRQALATPDTIGAILAEEQVGPEPDLLAIDVDGNDFWLWAAAAETIRPRLVVVEYNAALGPTAALVQPRADAAPVVHTPFFGASIAAFDLLAARLGYALVHTDLHGVNAFFVRRDLLDAFADLDLATIPRRPTNYDGRGRGHAAPAPDHGYLALDADGLPPPRSPRLAAPAVRQLVADGSDAVDPANAGGAIRVDDVDVGPMWTAADDREIGHWLREWKTWGLGEREFFGRLLRPGMNVVDIGANIGYFTLYFAERIGAAGRVLAIEPEPRNFGLLEANVGLNGLGNVELLPVAADRRPGVLTLSLDATGNLGGHGVLAAPTGQTVEVPAYPVDDLLDPAVPVHAIKIDVEGMDHAVVAGLARTIQRWAPTILVEFHPAQTERFGEDPATALASYRAAGLEVAILGWDALRLQAEADVDLAALVRANLVAPPDDAWLVEQVKKLGTINLVLRPPAGRFWPR